MNFKFQFSPKENKFTRKKITSDLSHIVSELKKIDHQIESVILTGSFSRGEGFIYKGNPQNDYDLIVIRKVPSLNIDKKYRVLSKKLSKEINIDFVDLLAVWKLRIPFLEKTLFWYETSILGKTIYGKEQMIKIDSFHEDELIYLLYNRMIALILARNSQNTRFKFIQLRKVIQACKKVAEMRQLSNLKEIKKYEINFKLNIFRESESNKIFNELSLIILKTLKLIERKSYKNHKSYLNQHKFSIISSIYYLLHTKNISIINPTTKFNEATRLYLQAKLQGRNPYKSIKKIVPELKNKSENFIEDYLITVRKKIIQ